jgi:hypothetical protein
MGMEEWWNDTDRGIPKNLEKTLSQCRDLSTRNPKRTDPSENPTFLEIRSDDSLF